MALEELGDDRRGERRNDTKRPHQKLRTVGRVYAEAVMGEDVLRMLKGAGRGRETVEMKGEKETTEGMEKYRECGNTITIKVWGEKENFNWEALAEKISLVKSWVEDGLTRGPQR